MLDTLSPSPAHTAPTGITSVKNNKPPSDDSGFDKHLAKPEEESSVEEVEGTEELAQGEPREIIEHDNRPSSMSLTLTTALRLVSNDETTEVSAEDEAEIPAPEIDVKASLKAELSTQNSGVETSSLAQISAQQRIGVRETKLLNGNPNRVQNSAEVMINNVDTNSAVKPAEEVELLKQLQSQTSELGLKEATTKTADKVLAAEKSALLETTPAPKIADQGGQPTGLLTMPGKTLLEAVRDNSNWAKSMTTSNVAHTAISKTDGTVLQSLKIQLNPVELGKIDLNLKLVQGQMQIDVRTQSEAAYKSLIMDQDSLVDKMRGLGLRVDSIAILSPQQAESTNAQSGLSGGEQRSRDGLSEGRGQNASDQQPDESAAEYFPTQDRAYWGEPDDSAHSNVI